MAGEVTITTEVVEEVVEDDTTATEIIITIEVDVRITIRTDRAITVIIMTRR